MANRPTDTKSRILQIALSLYSSHGCENTTIDDIITAIGITKGAFYHYFKSKESLCETVLDQVIKDYQQLTGSLDSSLEPIEQLRQITNEIAELHNSGQWVNCRLVLRLSTDSHQDYPKIQRKVQEFWRWYSGFYEELIEKCQNAGQLTSALDAKTQAQLLISVIIGTVATEKVYSHTDLAKLTEITIKALQL